MFRKILWCALAFLLAIIFVHPALVAQVADTLTQTPGDTVISTPDAHAQFVLGVGVIAAYIAREISSLLISLWNKAGAWLDGKSNGAKQAFAVFFTGILGLLINAVASALTHQTSWIVTGLLSVVMGFVSTLNAAVTIDAAKTKMFPAAKRAV